MKFQKNILIIFNESCLTILEAWENACHQAVAMSHEPTVCGGLEAVQSTEALRFLTHDIPFELRVNVLHAAQEILGPQYSVTLEATHYLAAKLPPTFPGGCLPT